MTQDISVIILTFNEEKHIERCIKSLLPFTKEIFIVDSNSTDKTVEIAESLGAKVYKNKWPGNHAKQFQWGLDNCLIKTKWIMKIDADEYVLPELASEINSKLNTLDNDISGIYIKRRLYFLDRWIKNGGYYPVWLLRIWRSGHGQMEQRWMDEHIKLTSGNTVEFENDLVDDNKNGLTAWTEKHNSYATKEAIDGLNKIYNFVDADIEEGKLFGTKIERKRWLRQKYDSLPLFVRPIIYFHYRYFFKLGFLDGKQGFIWHFLQGFWYRFYIDAKIYEIYHNAGKDKNAILKFIKDKYNIDVLQRKKEDE
ncbi:glycosyltransferase family 2 protein [Sulfurospirillum sp. 1612]|uniref:glycosyltransferase family 2 protein n=1 Tax=Sulfurospirillum sp. 1612 TaxID=3094835 RepID=UPI002F926216